MSLKYLLLIYIGFFVFINKTLPNELKNDTANYHISVINIVGNEKTKKEVIIRELNFAVGEKLKLKDLQDKIVQSEANLKNTLLFNFVNINYSIAKFSLSVSIELQEKWYLWPYPIFEYSDRNFATWLNSKEWYRINYGMHFVQHNFLGQAQTLSVKFRKGYKEQYSIVYDNIQIDKQKKHFISIEYSYFRQKEIAYMSVNNTLQYLSTNSDSYIYNEQRLQFKYTARLNYNVFNNIVLRVNQYCISDSIVNLNSDFLGNHLNKLIHPILQYQIEFEKRNSKVYPLFGKYFSVNLNLSGLPNKKDNFFSPEVYLKNQLHKKMAKKVFISDELIVYKSFLNHIPFVYNNALGYSHFVRGYENFIIPVDFYFLNKSEIKHELFKKEKMFLPLLNNMKFKKVHAAGYGKFFIDFAYSSINNTSSFEPLNNKFLVSVGIGLDIITYYDKVLRMEYSWNKDFGFGFFIHLGFPYLN